MVRVALEQLPGDGWFPYHYTASVAEGLVINEHVLVRLGNRDSLSIDWWYRWAGTPTSSICVANQVPRDNGWLVWTDLDPDRAW